jgi:glycine cleavage system H protein
MFPSNLRYTQTHEWARADDGAVVRVGITDHAAEAMGDIVFAALPEAGSHVAAGDSLVELESTKSFAEVYTPVPGVVVAVNEAVSADPAKVNQDPYGEGWLFEVETSDVAVLDALLSADAYAALLVDEE